MNKLFAHGPDTLHIGWAPVLSFTRAGACGIIAVLGVKFVWAGDRFAVTLE